ncbi:hypothetical protein MKW92_042777 [Papaver armeniacum]|nr:hypothetical protein MKW92_042777 [Papaver armeniacum]
MLVKEKLIQLRDPKPTHDPKPRSYDESKTSNYHQGPGHDTNSCWVLKHLIQDLLDEVKIVIEGRQRNPIYNKILYQRIRKIKVSTSLEQTTPKKVDRSQ